MRLNFEFLLEPYLWVNDEPDLSLALVGECMMLVFGCVHHVSTGGFYLALTVCEFRALALFHHIMLI